MSKFLCAPLLFGGLLIMLVVVLAVALGPTAPASAVLASPTPPYKNFLPVTLKQYAPPTPTPVPSSPPAAPTNLGATNLAQGLIRLYWTDNSGNEAGFRVEQYAAGGFSTVATTEADALSVDIGGLLPATSYRFRVYAFNAAGNSGYSDEVSRTTLTAPPAAPSNLVATALSNSRIQLDWTDNSDDELQFRIEQRTGGFSFTTKAVVPALATSTIITGLSGNTVYTYRVRAENSGGNSDYSNSADATTFWSFINSPPYRPSSLTGTVLLPSSVQLTWIDNSGNENGFRVEALAPGGSWGVVQTTAANITSTDISGLTPGTLYGFRMRAYNGYGNSSYSNEITLTTHSVTAPAAPSDLSAAATSNTTVVLNWQDNSNNETGFRVEQRTAGTSTFSQVVTTGADAETATRSSLTPGAEYGYRVHAYNTYGNSGYSGVVSVTLPSNARPAVTLPAAPTDLWAVPTSTTNIALYWTNNASNDAGIKIEHSIDGVSFADYFTGDTPGTNYALDGGLAPASTHYYRVRTHNAAGESAYSNVAWATTWGTSVPTAPDNLQAVAQSSSVIRLTYDHSMAGVEGFMLSIKRSDTDWYTDWATVTVKTVDVTGLEPGRQYWFKVRAYNRANATSLRVSGWNTNGERSATTQGSGTFTRFVNNASYPVISLKVNGSEKFGVAPRAIPVGGYYELPATAGNSYDISWVVGFWDEFGQAFTMYEGRDTFLQPSGLGTFTFDNPTLGQLLTHFRPAGGWGYWLGEVWSGTSLNTYGFCFQNNGANPKWQFYVNGLYNSSGNATIPAGGYPKPGTFNISFSVAPGPNYLGSLSELGGLENFYMRNGPSDWPLVQYRYAGRNCP